MPRFKKKPVDIEAWLWDESRKTFDSIGCKAMSYGGHGKKPNLMQGLRIHTLEGTTRVDKGDWIIKGVKGEFYPCKPDIFEATYDFVSD
jgi:hypothetical protein